MDAFLDDYGKITVYMKKNFYGGRADHFYLTCGKDYHKELVLMGVEEHEQDFRYEFVCPADLTYGKDYQIRINQGLSVPLIFRLIVRKKQFIEEFDYDGDDLGSTYHRSYTDFALWAPTACYVDVKVVDHGKTTVTVMTRGEKGVWRARVHGDLRRATYCYFIKRNGVFVESLDPYALSSTGNGSMSAIINPDEVLSIRDAKPEREISNAVDAVIYECSVRDMTSSRTTGTKAHSTFMALTEEGTSWRGLPTGLNYLSQLGVTHVQFQPVGDFVTVDEYHPTLNYNWGYDPGQYMSLEGSYSSNPDDPYARMKEFRRLVTTLHRHNMYVTCDVVFNHMYDVDSSAFNKTVPYYYFRYNDSGYLSNGSWCGNDFDSSMPMARKHLIRVVTNWMKYYGIDGYRFDLMGILDVETMNQIRDAAKKIKPYALIYGEGWNMPTMLDGRAKADIENQDLMDHIGHFNDYYRDIAKGKTSEDQKYERGYLTGDLAMATGMQSALVGNVLGDPYFFRFTAPDKTINGMETHDNGTMWDKMHSCCSNEDRPTRLKRQKMLLLTPLISQGVPFMHAGSEFCATKKDCGNSYNAGDDINQMDWDRAAVFQDAVEYTKKAIALRHKYKAFRLQTAEEIGKHVKLSVGDGGVVFYDVWLEDKNTNTKCVRCILNPSFEARTYHFDEGWKVIFDENGNTKETFENEVHVPGLSIVVCVQ